MELYQRDHLIARIIAGYIPVVIDGKRYKVYHPDAETGLMATEAYNQAYEEAQENELFNDEDILSFMINMGIWTEQQEKELLEIVPGHIEYWKIEMYTNMMKSNTMRTIRQYLELAKAEYKNLYEIRHSFDSITCAGYASYIKNMYSISHSTRYKGKRVNWGKVDLNILMQKYYAASISSETIRVLARTSPWNGMWSVFKANGRVFENTNLTTEQQVLISWSIMYDKIYDAPECPSGDVIDDDDLLDGWLLVQKRKREATRQKQELENRLGDKLDKADDVFLMAETPKDAQKIGLLNEPHMKKVKEQRVSQVKSSDGEVLEQQLADVKKKRAMQLRQAFSNSVKGR